MVLHFGVPMSRRKCGSDTWHTLGMRGTGSHDVIIEGHFVPDAAVALKRKAGEWHPLFQIIATIAFPLIYAVYLGVAESARDIAIDLARRKRADRARHRLAGRMDTALSRGAARASRHDRGRRAQRPFGGKRQRGDDRRTLVAQSDRGGGTCHGGGGRSGILPFGWS